jgi:hypothetical protein
MLIPILFTFSIPIPISILFHERIDKETNMLAKAQYQILLYLLKAVFVYQLLDKTLHANKSNYPSE